MVHDRVLEAFTKGGVFDFKYAFSRDHEELRLCNKLSIGCGLNNEVDKTMMLS
jgi:hypothetical protein